MRASVVPRDDDLGDLLQVVADGPQLHRLVAKIELAQQRLAKLLEQGQNAEALPDIGVLVEEDGNVAQRLEVGPDLLADARALDLERHFASVA